MKRDLLAIMKRFTHLTDEGFQWMGIGHRPDSKEFKEGRARLAASVREFVLCCDFLNQCQRRKTPNPALGSSYVIKQLVERVYDQHVSHGALISGVIHLGIRYRPIWDSTAIDVALSSRSPLLIMLRAEP